MVGKITYDGITYDDYVSSLPEISKNERRALLATADEFGAEGQARFAREAEAADRARKDSAEYAAARGAAIHEDRALQTDLQKGYDSYFDRDITSGAAQTLSHAREMDRIGAASDAYIRGVGAAADLYRPGGAGGGGGRGGGGRGGGGGGGGDDYAATTPNTPQMDLATAGELAGLALPSELVEGGTETTGTRMLLGEADLEGPGGILLDETGEPVIGPDGKPVSAVGGDVDAKNIFFTLQDLQNAGASPEQLKQVMLEELVDGKFTPSQVEALAATLDNYFGITGGVVEVGDYNVFGLDDRELDAVRRHAGGASAEGFKNDAASELIRFSQAAERATPTKEQASAAEARNEAQRLIAAQYAVKDEQRRDALGRVRPGEEIDYNLTPTERLRLERSAQFEGMAFADAVQDIMPDDAGVDEWDKQKAEAALYGSDSHWDKVKETRGLSDADIQRLRQERANRVARAVTQSADMVKQKAFT